MIKRLHSLRSLGIAFIVIAFLSGGVASWIWVHSNAKWRAHQDASFIAGMTIYYAMQNGTAPPEGVLFETLPEPDQQFATAGDFRRVTGAPQAARITNVPIFGDVANARTGRPLDLVILSPDIIYPLADLSRRPGQTAAETTADVFRLLASYCSDPLVLARMGDENWVEIRGNSVWGCDAAPADLRLLAFGLTVVSVAFLMTSVLNSSADFSRFAGQLRARRRLGGPTSYDIKGPQELQDIVDAVNGYLKAERAQLVNRAAVLSGVSHDLGTPATRLRLRAALISDTELRKKLESDIDSMTGIIESVLTYTRAEMSVEIPRKLSLNSLIDAIVADYQDMDRPVTLRQADDLIVPGGRSVFMSRRPWKSVVTLERQIIVTGRPVALERAITNLIDNALKYGRNATVTLETDSDSATIIVEDQGSETTARDIEALMEPFQRGDNATSVNGYGLGLTIVAAIANLHGGSLSFVDAPHGLQARFWIQRN